jgi:two-component system, chemotaxis family, CheB/CheR fusion protein
MTDPSGETQGAVTLHDRELASAQATHSSHLLAQLMLVGIGASAGGLAAFEAFFRALPSDTEMPMSFVIVQHLAPNHTSMLTELISRYTRLTVVEVTDGLPIRARYVYVIPPRCDMTLSHGRLMLHAPTTMNGQHLPIDRLFESLAEELRERAIGIVLSGMANDGTRGVRAIKRAGGRVIVQTPLSTQHDSMPRSAIATGQVDAILPPAEMPAALITYATGAKAMPTTPAHPSTAEEQLKQIFALLRLHIGHDFSQYKPSTMLRRIERRMAIHQIATIEEYLPIVEQPDEIAALFDDLLIGVTQFFRDPLAFAALQELGIPHLLARGSAHGIVRVWVPGCSTGEEAYSIAILLQEQTESLQASIQIQVFATDIDRQSIDQARSGIYPASISADISDERLVRCFVQLPNNGGYQIRKSIRDMLIFSDQDVIRDPPFSKIDLISCRNMLIYLGSALQKKLIPLFHYALNPDGLLFLGSSETVGGLTSLFRPLDRKARLYARIDAANSLQKLTLWEFPPPMTEGTRAMQPSANPSTTTSSKLRELTERALLQQYAPVSVLVNQHGDILYLHGRTGAFLELAPGDANLNILSMARPELRQAMIIALHQAVSQGVPAYQPRLRVVAEASQTVINLTVLPIESDLEQAAGQPLFLVILDEVQQPGMGALESKIDPSGDSADRATDQATHVAELQRELHTKEAYLQAANEELEVANEELRSSNEELQSVNEELQSTNEELETSKEELYSVNEELLTVNNELQSKVAALSRANNDLNNLLAGTDVGMIFLDHQLCIQRFTPAITQVINLIPTDIGRPISHIVANIVGYDHLVEDVQAVLDTLVPRDLDVQVKSGAWFLLRIRPYRTLEHVIEGAVITFTDVTSQRRASAVLSEGTTLHRLAAIVRDMQDAVIVHDNSSGRILAWNPGADRMYGWSEAEALALSTSSLVPDAQQLDELAMIQRLSQAESPEPHRAQRRTKGGRTIDVWVTATALVNEFGTTYAIVTTERSIV